MPIGLGPFLPYEQRRRLLSKGFSKGLKQRKGFQSIPLILKIAFEGLAPLGARHESIVFRPKMSRLEGGKYQFQYFPLRGRDMFIFDAIGFSKRLHTNAKLIILYGLLSIRRF